MFQDGRAFRLQTGKSPRDRMPHCLDKHTSLDSLDGVRCLTFWRESVLQISGSQVPPTSVCKFFQPQGITTDSPQISVFFLFSGLLY